MTTLYDDYIERKIQEKDLNAPRLTPYNIDRKIFDIQYHVHKKRVTICFIELENGTVVTGESFCAHPDNYDQQIGEDIAFNAARDKIWQLEGYLLKERMYKDDL